MNIRLNNKHILKLISESKNKYTIDSYLIITSLFFDLGNKLIYPPATGDEPSVYNNITRKELIHHLRYYIKKETVKLSFDELIELGILQYKESNKEWLLMDMDNIIEKADHSYNGIYTKWREFLCKGLYTNWRDFFHTEEFTKLHTLEKKLILYFAYFKDCQSKCIYLDLNNNPEIFEILNITNKYYLHRRIDGLLSKYPKYFRRRLSEKNNALIYTIDILF